MRNAVLVCLVVCAVAFGGLGVTASAETPPATEIEQVGAPVLSQRRVPAFIAATAADAQVRSVVARWAPAQARCVVAEQNGRTIVRQNANLPLLPASTAKLLTASTALEKIGADSTFETEVKGNVEAGRVEGPLYLVGGGDPLLFTAEFGVPPLAPTDARTSLEVLADRVVAEGIRSIPGGVASDDSLFDKQRVVNSWEPGYVANALVGPVGALTVNHGLTTNGTGPTVARDPATHAAEVFTQLLRARGVGVAPPPAPNKAPEDVDTVASITSPPVSAIVADMLSKSDNSTAEVLVKHIGRMSGEAPTTAAGAQSVVETVGTEAAAARDVRLSDGSGLDRGDRATCDAVVDVINNEGSGGALAGSLARAGESGTLDQRMRNTPAVGRLQAKTGTLRDVSALAGWARPDGHAPISFALIANGVNVVEAERLEDRLGVLLASRAPVTSEVAYAPDTTAP